MKIVISEDFSSTPGGRFISEGDFSGEEFRIEILKPKYIESTKSQEKLVIDMDGCFGFAPSFLEEAFGGLARDLNNIKILDNIIIICDDEPGIVDRIKKYVANALTRKK